MTTKQTLDPQYIVDSEDSLRSFFSATHEIALKKCLNHIDVHARSFIERSPFVCVGTQSSDGRADVSPRGDPCGFVQILNAQTLLIPDRPGNNRLDTLSNVISNPRVGLLFLIPGFDETMRVNGTAQLTRDPALLATMSVNERRPTIAMAVHVEEVFIHCAKALRRSKLWDVEEHQDRSDYPSLMKVIHDQTNDTPIERDALKQLDDRLEEGYRRTMY